MTAKREGYWTLIGVVIVPIIAFIGGMVLNAFTIAEKIATKPYVDDRIIETKKYADEKTAQVLKEAIERSDVSRSELLLKIELMSGELKTNGAVVGTKVDALMKSVQDLRDWQIERRTKH